MLLWLGQDSQLDSHITSSLHRTQDKVHKLQKIDFQSPGEKIHLMLLLLEQVSQLQIHTIGDPQGRSCLVRTQE